MLLISGPWSAKTRCCKFISPWRVGGELRKGCSTGLLSDRTRTSGRERKEAMLTLIPYCHPGLSQPTLTLKHHVPVPGPLSRTSLVPGITSPPSPQVPLT